MSIDPKRIALQVALRTTQLEGSDQASLEIAYETGYTTLDGADVPVSALIDAVIATEAELAQIIANDKANPYRSLLYGRSANLNSGDLLPIKDENEIYFIGIYSGVKDANCQLPLTEASIQEIIRHNRGNYVTKIRKYKMTPDRLYHTVSCAFIEGCVFSRTAAVNRFTNGKLSPLPDPFESLWVARAITYLVQEGWLIPEAEYYANFADSALARLKQRDTDMPVLPNLDANANAVPN